MRFTLSAELTSGLKELSRREGATLFMTLLAAFQTLLYRYTGQTDICVGTPIAGRNRKETEALIGFFINTLVLRGRVKGNLTFRDLLRQVREVTLGAYAHQDLPFERLVEELQLERDLNYTPLFQVMFSLQNTPREELQLPGLKLDAFGLENKMAKFDLGLSLSDFDGRLSGYLDYKSALFDAGSMAQLLEQWQILLARVAADPEQRLSDLPLLTAARVNGYAPADFPEAELSQEDFENLMMEMSRA
jgi:non-ribosomal peptide synthetase component F